MENREEKLTSVAKRWCEVLKEEGYGEHLFKKSDYWRLKKFSRVWRRILKIIRLKGENLSVFEVGCGGGKHLIQFALNGCRCVGLDCSKEVLERAENYIEEVSEVCGKKLNVELVLGDFLYHETSLPKEKFDIVFNVGVLEHFLNLEERKRCLKKMFDLAKMGGWIISIVPSGVHPLRKEMREQGLGGYNIPEIDYTPELLLKEMKQLGGKDICVIGHNILSYLLLKKNNLYPLKKVIYLIWQIIPISWLPSKFVFRHAGTLVAIVKK